MDAVDTSALGRSFLADDPAAGRAAAALLDSGRQIALSLVVFAETAFGIHCHYRVPRDLVIDPLRKRNISVLGADKHLVARALLLCRPSGQVSFANARTSGVATLYLRQAIPRRRTESRPPVGIATCDAHAA